MSLEFIRSEIDRIDNEIVRLLEERMDLAMGTRQFKRAVRDPGREELILDKVAGLTRLMSPDFIRRVYREIIAESRRLQQEPVADVVHRSRGRRILVVGLGRMGSWLTRTLARHMPNAELGVYDPDRSLAEYLAGETGALCLDGPPAATGFVPDLFLNVVPLRRTAEVFREWLPHLPESCVLGDLASLKGSVSTFYAEAGHPYVSCHPMFGPTFANIDDLAGENLILIEGSDDGWADILASLFAGLGVSVTRKDFAGHDHLMATSLSLPFALSLIFEAITDDQVIPGTTFRKHRDIAKGLMMEDHRLIAEILANPESGTVLERAAEALDKLRDLKGQESLRAHIEGLGTTTGTPQ